MKKINPADWIFDQWLKESLKNPHSTPDKMDIMELTPKLMAKLFTPSRALILAEIAQGNCKTIQQLSQKLKRPLSAVSRDLSTLEFYGLVKLTRNGKTKTPTLSKQIVLVPLATH